MWRPFDEGATIGQRGTEGGVILGDLEHDLGARITLERDCHSGVPFAVTCGIYGWFFHTRFLSTESEAEWPAMLDALEAILAMVPSGDSLTEEANRAICEAIDQFVGRFP